MSALHVGLPDAEAFSAAIDSHSKWAAQQWSQVTPFPASATGVGFAAYGARIAEALAALRHHGTAMASDFSDYSPAARRQIAYLFAADEATEARLNGVAAYRFGGKP